MKVERFIRVPVGILSRVLHRGGNLRFKDYDQGSGLDTYNLGPSGEGCRVYRIRLPKASVTHVRRLLGFKSSGDVDL